MPQDLNTIRSWLIKINGYTIIVGKVSIEISHETLSFITQAQEVMCAFDQIVETLWSHTVFKWFWIKYFIKYLIMEHLIFLLILDFWYGHPIVFVQFKSTIS